MRLRIASPIRFAKIQTKLLLAVTIATLVGGVGGAIVLASVPDSNGVIHSCYDTKNGNLVVIDPSAGDQCTNKQTALNWNQQGPQGPTGPQGPQGPAGSSGSAFVSNLVGADFTDSDLSYRDLSGRDISNGNFTNTNMDGTDFSNANLAGATIDGKRMVNTNMSGANLTGSNWLVNSSNDQRRVNLAGANLSNATFWHLRSSSNEYELLFANSDFHSANFTGTQIQSTEFDNSNLTGVDLSNRTLNEVTMYQSNLTNVNLSNTSLLHGSMYQSNLTGANLTNTIWFDYFCPDGFYIDNSGGSCVGHL